MDIVLRSSAAFVFVFALLRLMGRRELSTLEPFDVILLVVIGDLVQQGVTQSDMSLTGTLLAVGTFGLLVVVTSWLSFRSQAARTVLESAPIVILQHGRAIERKLPGRTPHARRGRLGRPRSADRLARERRMGDSRAIRPDQLHPQDDGQLAETEPRDPVGQVPRPTFVPGRIRRRN